MSEGFRVSGDGTKFAVELKVIYEDGADAEEIQKMLTSSCAEAFAEIEKRIGRR